MANSATIDTARQMRLTLAGNALTERQAKLYSQRLRRDMGREGLASFTPGDVDSYLSEAMLLLQCAMIERRANPNSPWRLGVKRAAEILEWLSQSSLKPQGAPLHLLSAAAYQLADYPAMALGHLRQAPDKADSFSPLLRDFLRGYFPSALDKVLEFWLRQLSTESLDVAGPEDLTAQTFRHVIMCIGAVCAYLRSGDSYLVERAVSKLERLAESLVYSYDPYSHLLAQLTAASCRRFVDTCLWPHIERLKESSSQAAGEALNQFGRSAYSNCRALVWPAQAEGIERLLSNTSFVLCTPTGSGKTTVATLAVVQGLFTAPNQELESLGLFIGNLILYLVPSRALAAEVETRLSQDLKGLASKPVVVTGLYGGVDWGPTDAWIQTDQATIVVCTFEKADALLRYLGVLFLYRVRLVVVDEAHMVEQSPANLAGLSDGSSRSFRLEQLGARLFRARDHYGFRVLALSAVAARAAPALARWVEGRANASPTTSSYRSTRQMLGRLEVSLDGHYTIRYDLMDGRSLKFKDEHRTDSPFVKSPIPPLPNGVDSNAGPEVALRAPTLWAALQLAAERLDGSKPTVLISITQGIEVFSRACAELIEGWPEASLPNYGSVERTDDLWVRCLASAADYFTIESVEYKLLQRGIAVHHGKMPGLLARRLKILIDRGYVRVILATSTLSEGVNIPVNYLLLPSVWRGPKLLDLQEFSNLIGRAGRPGVATEGSALVVLPERTRKRDRYGQMRTVPSRQWNGYQELIDDLEKATNAAGEGTPEDEASSPLSQLLRELERAWLDLVKGGTSDEFSAWLEQTVVVDIPNDAAAVYSYLDSLDAFLIAALQEVEELHQTELTPDQVEVELTAIWRRTYAFAAAQEEERLRNIWLTRGRSIKSRYPNSEQRRQIYRTSLSPRSANRLLEIVAIMRNKLQEGAAYAEWSTEQRFAFIRDILAQLSTVSSFRISTTLGNKHNFRDWPKLLRWWLAKNTLAEQPQPKQITSWYEFVNQNFLYRGAWGIGSILGLLLDVGGEGEQVRALEISDWPRSGLPWIAFWLKELITWGTLDPVAAFLLARGGAIDRPQAEADALGYYNELPPDLDPNDSIDPRRVRDWVNARINRPEVPTAAQEFSISVELARPASDYLNSRLTVAPLEVEDKLVWIDPAGYTVARSERPATWPSDVFTFTFELDVLKSEIFSNTYLRYT